MLIPIYIVGFIFGGIFLFAIAERIPDRRARTSLRVIGLVAGPVFFIIVAVFSGWKREKTYEVEWLTGKPAAKYLIDKSTMRDDSDVVALRRYAGNDECYEVLISRELADYLNMLPGHTVQVQYEVTYDFFVMRTYQIKDIGDFESRYPNRPLWRGGGSNIGAFCFPW